MTSSIDCRLYPQSSHPEPQHHSNPKRHNFGRQKPPGRGSLGSNPHFNRFVELTAKKLCEISLDPSTLASDHTLERIHRDGTGLNGQIVKEVLGYFDYKQALKLKGWWGCNTFGFKTAVLSRIRQATSLTVRETQKGSRETVVEDEQTDFAYDNMSDNEEASNLDASDESASK